MFIFLSFRSDPSDLPRRDYENVHDEKAISVLVRLNPRHFKRLLSHCVHFYGLESGVLESKDTRQVTTDNLLDRVPEAVDTKPRKLENPINRRRYRLVTPLHNILCLVIYAPA